MNFQPPEYDDPRDDEDRMNDGIRAALADKLGFSIEERGGSPVIVEDRETKPADLEHRVLWDEVVSLTAERTACRVTAENAEAAVKQARIDALEEAAAICQANASMCSEGVMRLTLEANAAAIESLKGTP